MAAGKDAHRMADAALHSMGERMGLSPFSRAMREMSTLGDEGQVRHATTPADAHNRSRQNCMQQIVQSGTRKRSHAVPSFIA